MRSLYRRKLLGYSGDLVAVKRKKSVGSVKDNFIAAYLNRVFNYTSRIGKHLFQHKFVLLAVCRQSEYPKLAEYVQVV